MQDKTQTLARKCNFWAFLKSEKFPDKKGHLIFWSIFILGLIADLWTKAAVFSWLKQKPTMSYSVIDGFFRLIVALNDGAAFGIASGKTFILTLVSAVALVIVIGIFFFTNSEGRIFQVALGLFTAGISGNLYDRIFNEGLVRDFIDVTYWPGKHWPAFNIADSMLCIAVGIILIHSLFSKEPSQKHDQQQK